MLQQSTNLILSLYRCANEEATLYEYVIKINAHIRYNQTMFATLPFGHFRDSL